MEPHKQKTFRCAIYTRKSSEEGLEQDFNSLHAQREACEAFVRSQHGEGWQLRKFRYDDGGLSGRHHGTTGSGDDSCRTSRRIWSMSWSYIKLID